MLDERREHTRTGHELTHAERLHHVVIGASSEAIEAIALRSTRGEHENPEPLESFARADLAAQVEAVDVGQRAIEDDERCFFPRGDLDRALTELELDRLEARAPQMEAHQSPQVFVVFDDQDERWRTLVQSRRR